jgi:two-component system, LytTR family, sensor kinase
MPSQSFDLASSSGDSNASRWISRNPNRTSEFWRFQAAGWALFALATAALKLGVYPSVRDAAIATLVFDGFSFLISLALWRLYRPVPHDSSRLRLIVIVGAVSLGGAMLHVAYGAALARWTPLRENPALPLDMALMTMGAFRFLVFGVWSALYLWLRNERLRKRADDAARVAQLQALRAQLDPHFAFNAINSILAEIPVNAKNAEAICHELTRYLRYSLAHRHDERVALSEELDALEGYLRVEAARFAGRLRYRFEIESAARYALVPGFFLQPLIENAVKHGMRSLRDEPGAHCEIAVKASVVEKQLCMQVSNTGRWRPPFVDSSANAHEGVGLSTLRERLRLLFPTTHRFEISHDEERVAITMCFPHGAS